ncbi:MAG: hypothetical protein P4K78_12510 [Terracidiphilus sp.]|nr:hypothetical protein [Terracidiphilus sp.]
MQYDPSIEAGLNMTAAPEMRELARRLLRYEADAGKSSEPTALRVYEKLRRSLGEFVGVAGFQSLASRALTLAKPEAPGLRAARVTEDGYLQGLGGIEKPFDMENDRAGEGGIILIARLLGLLRIFLGEALTLSLLRSAWPGEAFDDSNSARGGKS